jgi:hypothetical protein
MAALATLAFPLALRSLIDDGLVTGDTSDAGKGAQLLGLRNHFFELFGVAAALGLFSAGRFTWSAGCERVMADLRGGLHPCWAVRVLKPPQSGEVLMARPRHDPGANCGRLVAEHGLA